MNTVNALFLPSNIDTSTPVLLLGGRENALSLARSFGRAGITVRVSGKASCWGLYSKYCKEGLRVPKDVSPEDYWAELLVSGKNPHLQGHLIVACNDAAIQFIANNHSELIKSFVLPETSTDLQLALLDKKQTLELAQKVDVPTPQFWNVSKPADLEEIRQTVQFPAMVKPILSHEFVKIFGCKLFIIEREFDELVRKVNQAWDKSQDVMVVEMIPGPDSALNSYFTYVDGSGELLFDYTKCVIRRYPLNRGLGCFHKTIWLPETNEMGRKFVKGIGMKGFANIEFKRDPRDGLLKVIECNARFTAVQELIRRSGAPIDLIVYCSATKQECPRFQSYKSGLTLWYGPRDFLSFLELNRKGMLGPIEWVKSLLPFRHISPLHDIADPFPSLAALYTPLGALYTRILGAFGHSS